MINDETNAGITELEISIIIRNISYEFRCSSVSTIFLCFSYPLWVKLYQVC